MYVLCMSGVIAGSSASASYMDPVLVLRAVPSVHSTQK